jgi:type IV secretion system pilin
MTVFSTLGQVSPPPNKIISEYPQGQDGLIYLLNQIITLLYTLGGLMVFFNLLIAGYQYLSSNGDQQKILSAGKRITFSIYGLIFLVSSFVIAAILGQLLFRDPTALTKPTFWKVE